MCVTQAASCCSVHMHACMYCSIEWLALKGASRDGVELRFTNWSATAMGQTQLAKSIAAVEGTTLQHAQHVDSSFTYVLLVVNILCVHRYMCRDCRRTKTHLRIGAIVMDGGNPIIGYIGLGSMGLGEFLPLTVRWRSALTQHCMARTRQARLSIATGKHCRNGHKPAGEPTEKRCKPACTQPD